MADFFPGFEQRRVQTSGAEINLVIGGSGPPLLLLHGYPETQIMWRKVAPRLAEEFTLVIPDLRGYGDSSKPPSTPDHAAYSKRALAQDQAETMRALGFDRFRVAGHDRGARVTHRLLRDHPERIERAAILDIVPTLYRFETIDPEGRDRQLPLVLPDPAGAVPRAADRQRGRILSAPLVRARPRPADAVDRARCFSNPETIRATCEEYRAGASIDLEHDRAERGRKIAMPLLVLWGEKSGQGSGYDVLGVWRDHAEDVRGHGIASGHFIPEEAPDAAYQALRDFFAD
jgi:haloacetate dehalogenase